MKLLSLALLATLSAGLAGCAGMPSAEQARAEFIRNQSTAADEAEQAGDLALALNLRRSMLTMDPADVDTRAAIEQLQTRIRQRSAAAVKRGTAAYARGNSSEGDSWMLKALALQPGEPTALASLRQQAIRSAQAHQNSKPEQLAKPSPQALPTAVASPVSLLQRQYQNGDYQAVVAAIGVAPADTESTQLLRDAHVALAGQARQRNAAQEELDHLNSALLLSTPTSDPDLVQRAGDLRQQISLHWYQQGNSLLQHNLGAAIVALEKSVAVDPDNRAAKLKLRQAQTLQQNLQKIQRADSS